MTENRNQGMSRSAFEELAPRVLTVVFNRLSARFHDPQLAEEVSIDSLSQAFEKWRADPDYFRTHDLIAWSSRLASWRALDRLRERTRRRPLPQEHPLDGEERSSVPVVRARQENLSDNQNRDRQTVWDCIQELDPEDRAILAGYYYDSHTDQELGADLFGPAASTQANGLKVWRRRQRAHDRLRELLIDGGIEPADWSGPGGQAL
jgi:DNA-directed RNA polymerase specialized sigma24 family protein